MKILNTIKSDLYNVSIENIEKNLRSSILRFFKKKKYFFLIVSLKGYKKNLIEKKFAVYLKKQDLKK